MAFRHEQVLIAGMRLDGLCFNLHIAKPDHPADVGEAAGQLRLRLERDHPAIPDPPRQPVDEAALVGADITGNIARPEVPPDNAELGSLIAKQGLQRPGPKPDTLGRKPGPENGHGSAFRLCSEGWLFPARSDAKDGRPHADASLFNDYLQAMPGIDFSPHAVRYALATYGERDLGFKPGEAKVILDHMEGVEPT